jgi:hypothetical protein
VSVSQSWKVTAQKPDIKKAQILEKGRVVSDLSWALGLLIGDRQNMEIHHQHHKSPTHCTA